MTITKIALLLNACRWHNSKSQFYLMVLFFMIISNAKGQNNNAEMIPHTNKLGYGIQFRFGPSDRQNLNEIVISDYSGYLLSSDLVSMRYDLSLFKKMNDKWSIFTGLTYSSRNYFATYYCHVCDLGIHPRVSDRVKFRYLDVPIYARYRILDWKINWHLEFGAEVSFAINKYNTSFDSNVRLNDYSVNAFVGTGVDYDLNPRINFNSTLTYRNLIFSNSNYTFRAIEVKVGVIYNLNNKIN